MYIMVGGGSAQCILEVPAVPNVGDRIYVRTSMIKWGLTDDGWSLVGNTYKLTERHEDFDTGPEEFGSIPWFSIRIAF